MKKIINFYKSYVILLKIKKKDSGKQFAFAVSFKNYIIYCLQKILSYIVFLSSDNSLKDACCLI